MNIEFNGVVLDIAILVILFFSLIRGYRKGIVDRILHFASTIIIFCLSWFFSKPIANFFTFSQIEGIDPKLMYFISPIIGRIVGFVVIFVVLTIVRILVFMFLNAIIEGVKKHISIIRWIDNWFGAVFNVAKNVLLIYVVLILMCMPVFKNGINVVNDAKLAPVIMKVSPTLSSEIVSFGQQIVDFTNVSQWANRDFNMKDMVELMDAMNALEVFKEGQLDKLYKEYQSQIDSIPPVTVDEEVYNELMEKIENLPANDQLKNVARNKIAKN